MAEKPANPVHPRDSHDALQPHAVEPEPAEERQDDKSEPHDERPGGHARWPGRDATDKPGSG